MNPFDMAIVVILGYCVIRGIFRGLIKEVFSVIALVAGFYVAYFYHETVSMMLSEWITAPEYIHIISFILLFCIVFLMITVIGLLLRFIVKIALLGVLDRIFGGVFGALKAIVIISLESPRIVIGRQDCSNRRLQRRKPMRAIGLITLLAMCVLPGCGESGTNKGSGVGRELSGDGGWQDLVTDVAGGIFLGAEKGVIFYAYDVLTYPNEPVELLARVQMAKFLEDVPGVTVGFYKGSELLGTAKTDGYGRAKLTWTPPKEGDYSLTAKIDDVPDKDLRDLLNVSPAPLLVAARSKETPFVVIDLDHTVVGSSFFRVLVGGAKPMPRSVRVTRAIAKKYSIIYLTQRPTLLGRKSKQWLKDKGYPFGVLLLSELGKALVDSGGFKSLQLSTIKKSFPGIRIGIGDKPSSSAFM